METVYIVMHSHGLYNCTIKESRVIVRTGATVKRVELEPPMPAQSLGDKKEMRVAITHKHICTLPVTTYLWAAYVPLMSVSHCATQ